jgi:hypothetical protein
MTMFARLKISHHKHSGRLRPHEYTSYLPLGLLLVAVGIVLTVVSVSAASPPPQAGSVGLTGTVPGKAPKTAAVIKSPAGSQHFSTSPITIAGSCPAGTLVEIYKNGIFAGSGPCSDSGSFSIKVDLLFGQNKLVARVYNNLNQHGPDSGSVVVYYDVLPPKGESVTPLSLAGNQLILNTNAVYRGTFPDQELSVPVDIIGGTPPFAVNVQWGDSSNKIVPRDNNLTFNVTHTYDKPGTYEITLQATDSQDRVAFLTVAAIINGQPPTALTASKNSSPPNSLNRLMMLWPLYTAAVAVVVSFWLGERREKRILASHNPVSTSSMNMAHQPH